MRFNGSGAGRIASQNETVSIDVVFAMEYSVRSVRFTCRPVATLAAARFHVIGYLSIHTFPYLPHS